MIKILYSDAHMVVCLKPTGVLSQDGGESSMPQLLAKQLQVQQVYAVHRLDKAVGGVMVYALNEKAAAAFGRAVQDRTMEKTYFAVLRGVPQQAQGDLEDLLFHDKTKNKTYVVDRVRKGVKDAKLSYKTLQSVDGRSLVSVRLYTGRTHQIRVQFASRKLPLVGDGRYGGKEPGVELGLWSCGLTLRHPVTGKELRFFHKPPQEEPWNQFEMYELCD